MRPFLLILTVIVFSTLQQNCDPLSNDNNIETNLTFKNYSLSVGDTLNGIFEIKNNSDEIIIFSFPSSCQYRIWIKDGVKIYYESPDICKAVNTGFTIESHGSKQFIIHQKLVDNNHENLSPGQYTVEAQLLMNYSEITKKKMIIK